MIDKDKLEDEKMRIDFQNDNKPRKLKDPIKYRKLVNQFRMEWVEKSQNTAIQILDSAQNFSLWLTEKGYKIIKGRQKIN